MNTHRPVAGIAAGVGEGRVIAPTQLRERKRLGQTIPVVSTSQVAPTILQALDLNPADLYAVQVPEFPEPMSDSLDQRALRNDARRTLRQLCRQGEQETCSRGDVQQSLDGTTPPELHLLINPGCCCKGLYGLSTWNQIRSNAVQSRTELAERNSRRHSFYVT